MGCFWNIHTVLTLPTKSLSNLASTFQGVCPLPLHYVALMPARDLASPLLSSAAQCFGVQKAVLLLTQYSVFTYRRSSSFTCSPAWTCIKTDKNCFSPSTSLYIMDVSICPHHTKRADPIWLNYRRSSVNSRWLLLSPVVYEENTTNDRKLQGEK